VEYSRSNTAKSMGILHALAALMLDACCSGILVPVQYRNDSIDDKCQEIRRQADKNGVRCKVVLIRQAISCLDKISIFTNEQMAISSTDERRTGLPASN
jgi:hypothetical protein